MLVDALFEYLRPAFTLQTVFMVVGRTHFDLALRASGYVERAYAVDAPDTGKRMIQPKLPPNIVRVQRANGAIPIPEATVDVAFSAELDALEAVHRTLAPGGLCFCIAKGKHAGEAVRRAGFSTLRSYAGRLRVPTLLLPFLDAHFPFGRVVATK